MRNIEIKCTLRDPAAVLERALALGARDCGVLEQTDTFYHAPAGRLKLREFGDGSPAELIGYRRADAEAARESDYFIHACAQPSTLKTVLRHTLGEAGCVRKRRRLLLLDHTRIHLDEVEGLGTFAELETVITDQSEAEAREELSRIRLALRLDEEAPISCAYVDLIATNR